LSAPQDSAGSFRRLFRDMAIYGGGDILLRATGFLTLPIYTRLLSPDDYGVMAFVLTAGALVGAFLALGGDSAYARYFFEADTHERRQAITSTWFAFLAAWAFGLVVVALPFSGLFSEWAFGTDRHADLFVLALLTTPVTLMSAMFGQVLRNEFRPGLLTAHNSVTALLSIGLALVGVVVLDRGVAGILAGGLIGTAVVLPARIWAARRFLRPVFSVSLLSRLLAFGLPLVPASLAWWVFGTSDRFVLGKLSDLSELGLYSVAFSLVSVLSLATGALGQAWSPHAFHVYSTTPDAAPRFYGRMLVYLIAGFGTVAVALAAFAHPILAVLTTDEFVGAAAAVGPLALGVAAFATTQVTAGGISIMKRTSYLALYMWLAAALNLGLNLALVPAFGMLGAAWAMVASYVFMTLAYLFTTQRLWPIDYDRRRAVVGAVLTIAFVAATPLLPDGPLPAALAAGAGWSAAFAVALFAGRVVDRADLGAARSLLRRTAVEGTVSPHERVQPVGPA